MASLTKKFALLCVIRTVIALPVSGQERPDEFPSVTLPPELEQILRDYETGWRESDPEGLAALFTEDGFAMPANRPPVRGRDAIANEYRRAGGDLVLRAVSYSIEGSIGYIMGGYRYGGAVHDTGKFVLALRRGDDGRWLIAADIDNGNSD